MLPYLVHPGVHVDLYLYISGGLRDANASVRNTWQSPGKFGEFDENW